MSGMFDLTGKVAIVTGASSGIGAEAARAFAAQGADVVLLARRVDKLEALEKKLRETGRNALAVKCDVTNEEEVQAAVQAVIDRFGKIDILMNNAGVAGAGSVDELEESEWDRIMDINVKGIFLMSKHVVKHMKEREYGRIINTASICGLVGSKAIPLHAYNASKGAVVNLTRGMGASLAKHGITVNAIGPSLFRTEMTETSLFTEEALKVYNMQCPAGRPGNPGELNGAAVYFASDASSYTTGQILYVDGGWTAV
jgi:NAD(P)-dependent dehydrogenase (short-subunit alcohol dehydrogenase family)